MAQMQVFVSHSHEDDAFCRAVVAGLRGAGVDVWYDEHNLGSGQLMEVIQRELGRRPVVILILSKAAFASRWVRREITWAYELLDRDPSRLLLPVTAGPIDRHDFDPSAGWLFLHDFKRIEASGYKPFPTDEAVRRLLLALALTPAGEPPAPIAPRPQESVADLLERGKALNAQKRYAEAIPLFERATQFDARSFDAWGNLGYALTEVHRDTEALAAYDRALALDANQAWVWINRGFTLNEIQRYDEALAACDRALALDPNNASVWNNKGWALNGLKRYEEALAACDRALTLDPNLAVAWNNKGSALNGLKRYEEALAALDRALSLDETPARWANKSNALNGLQRYDEALAACDRALTLDPNYAAAWFNRGLTLEKLRRYDEALIAYDRGFDRNDLADWRAHARVYRALGRTADAEAAERRAKELGG